MFLSNWLVFKIVLAAVTGLVDYPVAADVLLVYDGVNKIYLSGGSLEYVSNVVLYKGETSYEIEGPNVIVGDEQKITASNADADDEFGSSVAISGDYAIVGAKLGDEASTSDAGAAYIFKHNGTSWSEQQIITASNPDTSDYFGGSVSLSGDYAIVGATREDGEKGTAYIFKRSGTSWSEQKKITSSDAASGDLFGSSVSIDGDYAIVGAPNHNNGAGSNSGSAYIFKRDGTSWSEQEILVASDTASSDLFGYSVGISGDYAIVGRRQEGAFIFKRSGTSWSEQQSLTASDAEASDYFGWSVSISGDYAIVGAKYEDDGGPNAGAAYIFKRNGTSWSQEAKLTASDAYDNDQFGHSVSISGDYAIVGAWYEDDGGADAGATYIFKRSGTSWSEQQKLTASDAEAGDEFGYSVGISGNYVIAGARVGDSTTAADSGSAYIYPLKEVTNYYITQPGTYRADLQICGIDYKTNEVEVTGTPSDIEVFKEPETDFTANKAVLSSTSSPSYHQGGMSDNGEYYYYGQQVYKKDTGSFTYTAYGSALSTTIFGGSWSSISHDGNYIVSYYTNSTYQLHIIKNNGSTFVNHQTITSPNVSAQSQSQPQFISGPLKHFVWIEKVSGTSNITFHFYKYNSGTDTWSLGFSVTNPTDLSVGVRVYGRGGMSFSKDGNYLAISTGTGGTTETGVAVLKVDWVNETCVKKYENTSVGYWACFLSRDAKYFYYSTGTGTTAGKMLYSANGDWEGTPTDVTSSFTNIGNLGDHSSVFSDRYIFSEKGGSAIYIFKWQDLISPTLTFDNYNKLSLTNTPTYTSSKLTYGSNVYDIGTLTSDITIEKQGEYASLTFDTSSNVAYFSNVTVGSLATNPLGNYRSVTKLDAGVQHSSFQAGTICFWAKALDFGPNYFDGFNNDRGFLQLTVQETYTHYASYGVINLANSTHIQCYSGTTNNSVYTRFSNPPYNDGYDPAKWNFYIVYTDSDGGTSSMYLPEFGWSATSSTYGRSHTWLRFDIDDNYVALTDVSVYTGNPGYTESWRTTLYNGGQIGGAANETTNRVHYFRFHKDNLRDNEGTAANDISSSAEMTTSESLPGYSEAPSLNFDTYNKLSLSGITNPTSKLHVLPTGAESTTTYDIGTATNIYIESEGTYTAEMKGSDAFALDSNTASLTTPSPNSQLYYPLTSQPSANIWSSTTDVSYGSDGVTFNSTSSTFGLEFTVPTSGIFTVSCNFMKTSFTSGVGVIIASSTNQNSPELESNFTATSYAWRSTNTGYVNTTGLTHYTNQWYHMVWVHDKNNGLTAYLDGVEVYSYSGTIASPQTSFIIGPNYLDLNGSPGTNRFGAGGKMSDIRIYDTAISSTEAELIYKADNKYIPKLNFDTYNKLTFTGADTGSTYKLKYESNTYDLGTISNVYIAYPGTYSAEIKGATNFALSSNVATIQTVTQPTLVSSISITASSAGWGSYTYEHQSTNTSSTYYEYKISADPTNSVYFIAYNWTTNKWYDTNPGTTHSTFGTSASDTSSTSRETTENPAVVYVMASNALHAQFINPYFLGPSLDFDTYNKLTLSGLESGSTSNVLFNGNTYSIGTASNVYISEQGTYEAESKGTTTFALTSNVTGTVTQVDAYDYTNTTEQKLTADANAANYDRFGESVAVSGDYAIIGAASDPGEAGAGNGAAYIFIRNGTSWSRQARIVATGGASSDQFGISVAIDGDYAVIGSSGDDDAGSSSGSAYIFVRSGTSWTQQYNLTAGTDAQAGDKFGISVSISGDSVIIGAESKNSNAGAAYVYVRNGSSWSLQQKITPSGATANDYFGGSVSISGNYAIIGARGDNSAYVFERNASTWSLHENLTASDGVAGDNFGFSVMIVGDYAIVGAIYGDSAVTDAGSAYVFKRNGTSWSEESILTASDAVNSDYFGQSVALDGDYAIVGAPYKNSYVGAVYIFKRSGTNWAQQTKMLASDGASSDFFGTFVAISGGYAFAGAFGDDDGGTNAGAAYIYTTPNIVPKLTHDTYNKLSIENITPTASTLRLGSNTYDIGTATDIYIEDMGTYEIETKDVNTFAFASNVVSGTIKTIELGFASRYQGSTALTYDGKLYAWGWNDEGEAGVGTSSDITVPTLCTGITQGTVAKLLSGSDITENSRGQVSAIKTTDGKIYMAGKGDNYCIPGKTSEQTSFTDVTSYFGDQSLTANTITMMSFTDRSGAALTETGNVWTWGTHDSTYKALGQAGASSSSTPKQINFSPSVSVGDSIAWDSGAGGQWATSGAVFYKVSGINSTEITIRADVDGSASQGTSLTYVKNTGYWNDTLQPSDTPHQLTSDSTWANTTSVQVSDKLYVWNEEDHLLGALIIPDWGLSSSWSTTPTITKITCGHYHSLALDSSGDVWFWGKNGFSTAWPSSVTDEPQKVVDGKNIIGLASSYGAMYAWDVTSKMWNAGDNSEGQIGDGTITSAGKTLTEVTYFSSNNITINKVYAGGEFVFADTSDGYYCWGAGTHGVFGNGSTGNITSGPAKWTNVSNIKKFMASTQHTTAITEDGKYYAWGRGYHLSRGDNDTGDITYPKYIDTLPNILAPSFEFDGYDKILLPNKAVKWIPLLASDANTHDQYIRGGNADSSTNGYWYNPDGSQRTNGPELKWDDTVGSWILDSTTFSFNCRINKKNGTWSLSHDHEPGTQHGSSYTHDDVVLQQDTTEVWITTNAGAYIRHRWKAYFEEPYNYENTKYTKDTHTYDANKAQIVTVSDPGTYDAQIKGTTPFSLKSATIPETKTSGLYTWAFHHGNFDNAYGDGDILTARENGRFYADTPAYTSASIGTITPANPNINSYTYTVSFKVINQSGTTIYDGTDGSIQFTMTEGVEYDTRTDLSTTLDDAIDTALSGGSGDWTAHGFQITSSTGFICHHAGTAYDTHTYTLGTLKTFHSHSGGSVSVLITNPYYNQTTYTFTPASTLTANVLMVAGGGGGGGRYHAGGGGAGGLVYTAGTTLSGTKTIVVGNGDSGGNATGSPYDNGYKGKDTTFTDLDTAIGGGGGGANYTAGNDGGSGGGGGASQVSGTPNAGGSGTANQGNDGGVGIYINSSDRNPVVVVVVPVELVVMQVLVHNLVVSGV
jgi:alpha-tubulin suppressor-like RCC1 family protein